MRTMREKGWYDELRQEVVYKLNLLAKPPVVEWSRVTGDQLDSK
jgi:hypothetical protein